MSEITLSWRSWNAKLGLVSWLVIAGGFVFFGDCAFAQLAPDTTLDVESSVVTPNIVINGLPSDRIDSGAIRGANLFHSFQQFNINEGRGAYFTNPAGIENIVSRVTGGSRSELLGTLGVLGNANLFLINPNGIIFGSNASLDTRGSFVATTANAIGFGNQDFFSATNPEAPSSLLTVNPSALLFNQLVAQQTNSIEVRGNLAVDPNQSLLLVGGNVSPTASSTGQILIERSSLNAPGGRVELGGLLEVGTVGLNVDGTNLSLSFPNNGVVRTDVSLTEGADVNVRAGGGGNIAVNARNLTLDRGSGLRAGINTGSGSIGARAGDIEINAMGTTSVTNNSFIANVVQPEALGDGGNINITTGSLSVTDGAQLLTYTDTQRQGNAGNVAITAHDGVSIAGLGFTTGADSEAELLPLLDPRRFLSAVISQVGAGAVGNGGNIRISVTAGSLSVAGGGALVASTQGNGNAGSITVNASDRVSFAGEDPYGFSSNAASRVEAKAVGIGGNIDITARELSLTEGALLTVSTDGGGDAGSVTITARDRAFFDGVGGDGFPTGAYSRVLRQAGGQAGNVNVTVTEGTLSVTNGAQLSASTRDRLDGGNVILKAKTLEVLNGGQVVTNSLSSGNAGNIIVDIADRIILAGSDSTYYARSTQNPDNVSGVGPASGLIASTVGSGNAGELTLDTRQLIIRDGARVSADTQGTGRAGTLVVNATESVEASGISTTADGQLISGLYFDTVGTGNGGDAGDLRINTGRLVVREGAQVSARTTNIGRAGTLEVNASESVDVFGSLSRLVFDTESTGDAKGLRIETGELSVRDGGEVTVSSRGTGASGNLEVVADSILLNNQGKLQTITLSGEGGNIRLQVQDLILMRYQSEISASAEGFGNGGNIEIDIPNGLIVAIPKENSDIVASATEGNGGSARATAAGVFGFRQFRDRRTPESDFTASSELGIDGTLEIITPNRQLEELPGEFADVEIAQGCEAVRAQDRSRFVVTGRGGLPPNPKEALSNDAVEVDLVSRKPEVEERSRLDVSAQLTRNAPAQLVEAQGWVFGDNGEVVLTATAPTVTPGSFGYKPLECNAP